LVFLSLAYAGILAQQPNLCAVCLDIRRRNAGAVFGFMSTAATAASAISPIALGYIVGPKYPMLQPTQWCDPALQSGTSS
jgi:hypothetical protein